MNQTLQTLQNCATLFDLMLFPEDNAIEAEPDTGLFLPMFKQMFAAGERRRQQQQQQQSTPSTSSPVNSQTQPVSL